MDSQRSYRSLVGLAVLLSLVTASESFAHNLVRGRWVAQLPGGRISYYHFQAGAVVPDGSIQGRFVHMYLDERGLEHVINGTYVLFESGPWGKWGHLTLLFDNGLQFRDIEHREPGVLKLHHVGSAKVVVYHRQ